MEHVFLGAWIGGAVMIGLFGGLMGDGVVGYGVYVLSCLVGWAVVYMGRIGKEGK